MDIRYELLKWYPSLPKDWVVGMVVRRLKNTNITLYTPCDEKYTNTYLEVKEVSCTEYWKEILPDVTNDGVSLNVGDKFYVANLNNFTVDEIPHIYDLLCDCEKAKSNGYIWFSSFEKALDYVDRHEIRYTKQNMNDFGKYVAARHAFSIGIIYDIDKLLSEFHKHVTNSDK